MRWKRLRDASWHGRIGVLLLEFDPDERDIMHHYRGGSVLYRGLGGDAGPDGFRERGSCW